MDVVNIMGSEPQLYAVVVEYLKGPNVSWCTKSAIDVKNENGLLIVEEYPTHGESYTMFNIQAISGVKIDALTPEENKKQLEYLQKGNKK